MELSHRLITLVPRHVFRTARNVSASSRSVLVELRGEGLVGIGEAAPSRFYGETPETVVAYLDAMRPTVEACRHESELMAELAARGGTINPAARASLEIAAHDMLGKRHGIPLYRHFGLDPSKTPVTTMSIGLDRPEAMVEKALEARGFPMLKVKMDRETDPGVVARIKEATRAEVTVDANCGWSRAEAVERARELERIGVVFIEQPVPADDIEGLALVSRSTSIPVFADESCPTSEAIPGLADAVRGIVVKLMKCGGLLEATRMARMAKERGLMTMLGCMMESSLAITAAAHISPLADYADLDSGLLLANDPFVGVAIDRGRMALPDAPGLGVTPAGRGTA